MRVSVPTRNLSSPSPEYHFMVYVLELPAERPLTVMLAGVWLMLPPSVPSLPSLTV